MTKGIFKRIHHKHIFKTVGSTTLMKDIFEFEAPLGILGKLANKLFLEKYLKNLLENRNQIIKEFAESDKWKDVLDLE